MQQIYVLFHLYWAGIDIWTNKITILHKIRKSILQSWAWICSGDIDWIVRNHQYPISQLWLIQSLEVSFSPLKIHFSVKASNCLNVLNGLVATPCSVCHIMSLTWGHPEEWYSVMPGEVTRSNRSPRHCSRGHWELVNKLWTSILQQSYNVSKCTWISKII